MRNPDLASPWLGLPFLICRNTLQVFWSTWLLWSDFSSLKNLSFLGFWDTAQSHWPTLLSCFLWLLFLQKCRLFSGLWGSIFCINIHLLIFTYIMLSSHFKFYCILILGTLLDYLESFMHHSCAYREKQKQNKWVKVFLKLSHNWCPTILYHSQSPAVLPASKSISEAALKFLQLLSQGFSSMLLRPILPISILALYGS